MVSFTGTVIVVTISYPDTILSSTTTTGVVMLVTVSAIT